MAAKVNHTILRKEPDKFCDRARKFAAPVGFQSQLRSSLTPAHINMAIGQVKKI
jgi:hypothetical protein